MLLLLLKGFWWAASWPYSTWLLAVDKAICRMNDGCEPQHHVNEEGQVGIKESSMANEAFMKPEIPESMRDLMKMSIEQAYVRLDQRKDLEVARDRLAIGTHRLDRAERQGRGDHPQ